ncbi:MAG: hypothetical protein A3J27_03095 [Candidatus Tectomicrobia bacterium RIFCSPLOWO2_12_FULL_69_37]|nr:MAG: hypothetical protein A3J27_03095 [Candidatus Tectomicrobia bacterium RIFCSPLOWO2_12_FULL_69_37]
MPQKMWLTPEISIEALSYPLGTGGWAAEARVGWTLEGAAREQKLFGANDKVFPTREEADRYAIGLGVQWISSKNLKNLTARRAS